MPSFLKQKIDFNLVYSKRGVSDIADCIGLEIRSILVNFQVNLNQTKPNQFETTIDRINSISNIW
jgi:hypothetical protein